MTGRCDMPPMLLDSGTCRKKSPMITDRDRLKAPLRTPKPRARNCSVPRRLSVAIVDEELPYPPNSGKRIRTLNLVLRLSRRHNITYICHRNSNRSEVDEGTRVFKDHGIETLVADRSIPSKTGLGFYARAFLNLFSHLPYSVATHCSRPLRRLVQRHARHQAVDLWQCEWTPYAAALDGLPSTRRLVIAHNVESLIWQRYGEVEQNPLKRWYIKRQWLKYRRFERKVVSEVDHMVAVSHTDAALFRDEFGAQRVEVVDNGVDTTYFYPTGQPRKPRQILFLGSLDWRPNLDAVQLLLNHIFPAVLSQEPSAECYIVGRNPPDWLKQKCRGSPRVSLHGNVDDVRPYLTGCQVLAIPLRVGGGSRLKILEALACGTPVVTTPVGAEGLVLEAGKHLVVAEVEQMAEEIVACIRNPAAAATRAAAGRCRILERYDWDYMADRLEDIWLRCARGGRGSAPAAG